MNLKSDVIIFTDGASRGNPGPGGWGAVLVWKFRSWEVREIGGREEHTTNNRMELTAALEALRVISNFQFPISKITIYSDSSYLVNGVTKWIHGWQKNGWKTKAKQEVENRDLWEELARLITIYRNCEWKQVEGHAGVAGNTRCDEIATAFADDLSPKLYSGILENYSIRNILDVSRGLTSHRERGQTSNPKKRSRAAAYSYVSEVDGKIETHKTWVECEARVKGAKGAKYKKVFSADEEKKLTAEWGGK